MNVYTVLVFGLVPGQLRVLGGVPFFNFGVVVEGHDEVRELLVPVRRERRRRRVGRNAIAATSFDAESRVADREELDLAVFIERHRERFRR